MRLAVKCPLPGRKYPRNREPRPSATVAEEEFLNLAFVHFEMGWRLAKSIGTSEINGQQADIRHFFSLPLPHVVWEKTKSNRNPKFVRFVERALRRR